MKNIKWKTKTLNNITYEIFYLWKFCYQQQCYTESIFFAHLNKYFVPLDIVLRAAIHNIISEFHLVVFKIFFQEHVCMLQWLLLRYNWKIHCKTLSFQRLKLFVKSLFNNISTYANSNYLKGFFEKNMLISNEELVLQSV